MSQTPEPPDPHRTVTPGGLYVDSPFARQFVAPQPIDRPAEIPKLEQMDMRDFEEANHRLQELIDQLESSTLSRLAHMANIRLVDQLQEIQDLIYRNLP